MPSDFFRVGSGGWKNQNSNSIFPIRKKRPNPHGTVFSSSILLCFTKNNQVDDCAISCLEICIFRSVVYVICRQICSIDTCRVIFQRFCYPSLTCVSSPFVPLESSSAFHQRVIRGGRLQGNEAIRSNGDDRRRQGRDAQGNAAPAGAWRADASH